MPVVWYHHGYSMLALGIALLPFYFYCSVRVLDHPRSIANFILFQFACLVAVFMDGYTYMMFAVATGFAFLFSMLQIRNTSLVNIVDQGFYDRRRALNLLCPLRTLCRASRIRRLPDRFLPWLGSKP